MVTFAGEIIERCHYDVGITDSDEDERDIIPRPFEPAVPQEKEEGHRIEIETTESRVQTELFQIEDYESNLLHLDDDLDQEKNQDKEQNLDHLSVIDLNAET